MNPRNCEKMALKVDAILDSHNGAMNPIKIPMTIAITIRGNRPGFFIIRTGVFGLYDLEFP